MYFMESLPFVLFVKCLLISVYYSLSAIYMYDMSGIGDIGGLKIM
jgi:hypothetical protein